MLLNKFLRFGFKSLVLFSIFFGPLLFANNYANAANLPSGVKSKQTSVATSKSAGNISSNAIDDTAANSALSPMDVLHEVKKRSAAIATVKTNFVQEKYLDFLDAPITISGHLYFATHDNSPSLLWEYSSPAASGIWFDKGTIWLWAHTRSSLREPQGHEKAFVNGMMEQILFWLQINPKKIESLYTLELIEEYTIKLSPKRKGMFKTITVKFNDDLQSLQTLVLEEKTGGSTKLFFSETEYNIPAISHFPDGTPLP